MRLKSIAVRAGCVGYRASHAQIIYADNPTEFACPVTILSRHVTLYWILSALSSPGTVFCMCPDWLY